MIWKITCKSKVLSEASQARIAAGPSGAPPAGPSGPPGPPPAAGPSGPPESAEPPQAAAEAPAASAEEGTFEPAENGYFFRKMPDGSYDQTVYVQNEAGDYVPYQA